MKIYSNLDCLSHDFSLICKKILSIIDKLCYKHTKLDIDLVMQHISYLKQLRDCDSDLNNLYQNLYDLEFNPYKEKLKKKINAYRNLIGKKLSMDLQDITKVIPSILPSKFENQFYFYKVCCPEYFYTVFIKNKAIIFRGDKQGNLSFKSSDDIYWLPSKEENDFTELHKPSEINDVFLMEGWIKPSSSAIDNKFPYIKDACLYVPLGKSLGQAKTKACRLKASFNSDFKSVSTFKVVYESGYYWLSLYVEAYISGKTQKEISHKLGVDETLVCKWSQTLEDIL